MHTDKKVTKEDTWRPADLRRYIRDGEHGDDYVRRHRGGDSTERRHRESEKESRRERHGDKESTRERRDEDKKYAERKKEGSQDWRGDKEKDRRDERDREKRRERDILIDEKYGEDYRENRDRRREEKHERQRDKERYRDKEKERLRERERKREEDRDKKEDKDRERTREEWDREHRIERERRRHKESGEGGRDETENHHREQRAREKGGEHHRDKDKRNDKEIQDRKHSERKEERGHKEEHRKHKEERERRHKERGHHEEKRKHSIDSREYGDLKGSGEEVRHHREDRERADKERRHRDEEDTERKHRERRHRDEDDAERKHRERRHRDEDDTERKHRARRPRDEDDAERKHRERRHRDEDDTERKHSERRHRDEDDTERKHSERRHRDEDDTERKHSERRHRDEDNTERKYRERRHKDEDDAERKHTERRHREEEDDPRDTNSSKKSSSDRSHRPEWNMIEAEGVEIVSELWTDVKDEGDTEEPVVNEEDLADQEYEDDFEDYEEDFEEMDESANEGEDEEEPLQPQVDEEKEEITSQQRKEIEAIQRAIDEENERVGTAQSLQSTGREEESRPRWSKGSEKNQSGSSQHGKFIDFVAAKQREVSKKTASKQKKRSSELLRLIDLDFSMTLSLLDLPPVSEYDMYIRHFGTANTKQAYVQCNEDNADRDIQTEEIEMRERWTQHPPEYSGACGDPNLSQEARDKETSEMNFDSQRLTSFLRSASQVMVVLLEEDQAERKSLRKLKTQTDSLSFSDGSLQLNTKLSFLYGRQIRLVHFSQVQRHTMMSVHMPTSKPSPVHLDSCTIICIWNIWEPSRPQNILIYESEIQCCCFSPGKAILVFAGTSVGSVVLWDLREHASSHYCLKIGEEKWTFRQPTFSTDAVMAGLGHFSSVTSIEVVPSSVAGGLRPEVPLLASEEESSGLSFQLASLDESGVLNFWVVVELPKGNEAGSPIDLGLRPGGKVKLLHSSSLLTAERPSPRDAVKTGPIQTLVLKFLPTDSNRFFIGTNMGRVNHGTSHGMRAAPKFYRCQEEEVQPVDVTSIQFSPFKQHLFLVGCGNGSIRLHAVSLEQPIAEWTNSTASEPVVSLQWAQTRQTIFCALDAASNLYIWDLLKNDTEPVITERMNADRVTAMALFGDSGQQNTYSGIALAHESGKIEMHYFTRNLTVSSSAEEEKLKSLMTEAF